MQVSKSYAGTLESVGSTGARQISYGLTTTVSTYPAKADFINQTVADFLHDECGVDAAYEARGDSTAKFLWIYGVPFLFAMPGTTSTYNYFNFFGPFYATALLAGSTTTSNAAYSTLFSAYNSGVYSFSLFFTGNPKTGFALRIKGYNVTGISSAYLVRFVKATNVGTGRNATVWFYGNPAVATTGYTYVNGIDFNEDGSMNESSFSTDVISFYTSLRSKAVNKASGEGKFPLVPIMAGIWKLNGMYCHLAGYGLTAAFASSVANQTEVQIDGRRFIVTTPEAVAAGYINIGLIEVDD